MIYKGLIGDGEIYDRNCFEGKNDEKKGIKHT